MTALIVFCIEKIMAITQTSKLVHPSGEHSSCRLSNLCYVIVSSHPCAWPDAL